MTSIKISELAPAGSNLFEDQESFLHELTDDVVGGVEGGLGCDHFLRITVRLATKAGRRGRRRTINTVYGNSMNNNTINGQGFNGQTFGNINTIG